MDYKNTEWIGWIIPAGVLLLLITICVLSGYVWGDSDATNRYIDTRFPLPEKTVTKEISIIKEKKDCEAKGGDFVEDWTFTGQNQETIHYRFDCKLEKSYKIVDFDK